MVLLLPHFGNQVDVQIAERAIRRNRIRSSLSPCRPSPYTSGSTPRSRSKSPLRCHGNKISLFSDLDLCFLRPSEKSSAVICDQDDSQITVLGRMRPSQKLVWIRLYYAAEGIAIKSKIKHVLNEAERRARCSKDGVLGLCAFKSRYIKENGFCMVGLVLEPEEPITEKRDNLVEVCNGEPHAIAEEDEEENSPQQINASPTSEKEPQPSLLSFGNMVDINVVKAEIKSKRTVRHPNLPVLGSTELSFRDPRSCMGEPFVEPETADDTTQIRTVKCYHKQLKKMVHVSYLKKSAVKDLRIAVVAMLNIAKTRVKDAQTGRGPAVVGYCAFSTSLQEEDAYHIIGLVTH